MPVRSGKEKSGVGSGSSSQVSTEVGWSDGLAGGTILEYAAPGGANFVAAKLDCDSTMEMR